MLLSEMNVTMMSISYATVLGSSISCMRVWEGWVAGGGGGGGGVVGNGSGKGDWRGKTKRGRLVFVPGGRLSSGGLHIMADRARTSSAWREATRSGSRLQMAESSRARCTAVVALSTSHAASPISTKMPMTGLVTNIARDRVTLTSGVRLRKQQTF